MPQALDRLPRFARMDGAQLASITISQRKARIAVRFRRETRVLSPGGIPLVVDGKLVGAIGCSGGTGDQDATVCKAGVDALK